MARSPRPSRSSSPTASQGQVIDAEWTPAPETKPRGPSASPRPSVTPTVALVRRVAAPARRASAPASGKCPFCGTDKVEIVKTSVFPGIEVTSCRRCRGFGKLGLATAKFFGLW